MKYLVNIVFFITVLAAGGCDRQETPAPPEGRKVETTGKQETAVGSIPAEVLAAAREARPELEIAGGEYEVRDGHEYYDVGGTLPDGSELELDMTVVDGQWTVVEIQRDIGMAIVPGSVREVLAASMAGWEPGRIIESDQGDGVVIYEFFGPGDSGETRKVEVKLADGDAELLIDEWVH